MAKLTVKEAARAGYASAPTIYRKLRDKTLSADPLQHGPTIIDTTELERAFGPSKRPTDTSHTVIDDHAEITRLRTENDRLRAENEHLRDQLQRSMSVLLTIIMREEAPGIIKKLGRLLGRRPGTQEPR